MSIRQEFTQSVKKVVTVSKTIVWQRIGFNLCDAVMLFFKLFSAKEFNAVA
ncbi:hypothetical protein L248_2152 [Schleiferilactobacillus shenzhenensis LY-73]|uniref:Uncharacterized protein n=1 Tax=Schleiferilactobacillus shenzhenensis LY-73 TaxID=1231336 RepID=U4TQK3_9LACO|nr:hypothetical protein L248_2152 [Schleiferilactobacillus shenzhenensis LY-73]